MSFAEIEKVIGFSLSPSARKNRANWANSRSQSLACSWLKVGYRTVEVNLEREFVVFEKNTLYARAFFIFPLGKKCNIMENHYDE